MNSKTRSSMLLGGILILTLASCNQPIDRRLVGKWMAQKPETLNKKVAGGSVTESSDNANQQPLMTIEFFDDGRFVTKTQMGKIDSQKQGSWKTLSQPSAAETIRIQCDVEMQQTEHEIEFKPDSIRWIPPNMAGTKQKILFVRVEN